MATSYADTSSRTVSGRDMLDGPPPLGRQRSAPGGTRARSKSKLASLALDTPEGEIPEDELSDEGQGSELDNHPVVQVFDHYAQARGHLQIVGTLMPQVMATVTDLTTLLDQLIPQQAAAMLSGSGMIGSPSMGAGTPQPGVAQGPPSMGLGALAGTGGVGAPAGPPMMGATPGAPMM
jgi:hypothetical protein